MLAAGTRAFATNNSGTMYQNFTGAAIAAGLAATIINEARSDV